jgi:hypothetical protein
MPSINPPTNDKDKKEEKKEEHTTKIWNDSEVQLLKKWGETAASYRLLHNRAFRYYNGSSYWFAVPVIVFSTITGTASFSQTLFPPSYQPFVPMVIGGVNIFIGILGTLARFFRVDELTESHRVASVSYGKFARNIATELSLPPQNRKYNGVDLVEMCRGELDRLIEQSPEIPMHILLEFKNNPDFQNIEKPEVLDVKPIQEYKVSKEEKVAHIVTSVVEKLRQNKPEKSLVQQLAEKHGNAPSSAPNPFTNNYVQSRIPPMTQALQMANANKITDAVSNTINNAINNGSNVVNNVINSSSNVTNENVSKIAAEQKERINEELNNIVNSNVVSAAKARFQGLMKSSVSKEQLKNVTTKIVNNAITNGENAIADIEMGIVKTSEELKNNIIDEENKNE